MTRKYLISVSVIIVAFLLLATLKLFWLSGTNFEEDKKTLLIRKGTSYPELFNQMQAEGFIKDPRIFGFLAGVYKYPGNIKPGRYVISRGTSVSSLIRTLRSGKQTPVRLVIGKIRLREDLARKISLNFETDSASLMNAMNDTGLLASLEVDTQTLMTLVLPNTYELNWNSAPEQIIRRLAAEQKKFWTEERKRKATALNLNPRTAYVLASIVEEETNMQDDKGKIASVYLNRLETGMKLGADPTVKFAMRDFGLKRILQKHLAFPSPYNTYLNAGLPPGPICSPAISTIDAVLNAPSTTYLYFVAKPDFRGYSNFATTYGEHLVYARQYQQALDKLMAEKAKKDKSTIP
jgi:UPF0755 protein